MIGRGWLLAGAFAACGAAYFAGCYEGAQRERAAMQADLADAMGQAIRNAQMAGRAEAARLEAESARDALAQELEDAAHAEPAGGDCLPVGRVRRLNALR